MIAIVINSLGGGGAERSMIQIANSLSDAGIQTSVIAVNDGGFDLIKSKARTFELGRKQESGFIDLILTVIKFRRVLKEVTPNRIILNCDLPEFLGCFAPTRIRTIVVEHANPSWRTRKFLGYFVRKIEYLKRVTWVTVSSHLQITYCRSARAITIENPIPDILLPTKYEVTSSRIKRLVFIGRLEEVQKRPSMVLKVSEKLSLPCLIVGEGRDAKFVKHLAQALKVNAEFKPYLENPWLEIEKGDLLIVPSTYEGDGLVVVEGIIRRIPIILSKIVDFERFLLPPENYFETLDELCEKILTNINSCQYFAVSPERSKQMIESRSLRKISEEWRNVLSLN